VTPRRRTALVTGASQGLGLALARLLAADGHDLVLVARGSQRLQEAENELRSGKGLSVRSFAMDLSGPDAARALWEKLAESTVEIDILVNNAGVGLYGAFKDQEPDAIAAMEALNIGALTMLTRLALPGMLERGFGRILNVASVAGYQPGGPGMAAYYATKSYVLSFSKALARELAGTGVSVTALSPGPVRTSFEESSGAGDSPLYRFVPTLTAEAVARAGYRGMMRGRATVIPGITAKLMALAGELPPRRIALEVNRILLSGPVRAKAPPK
jgi:short-subunit dehydrogenase